MKPRPATGVFFVPQLEDVGSATKLYRSLKTIDGVSDVTLNFVSDKAFITFDPQKVSPERIKEAIISVTRVTHSLVATQPGVAGGTLSRSGTAINPTGDRSRRRASRT